MQVMPLSEDHEQSNDNHFQHSQLLSEGGNWLLICLNLGLVQSPFPKFPKHDMKGLKFRSAICFCVYLSSTGNLPPQGTGCFALHLKLHCLGLAVRLEL